MVALAESIRIRPTSGRALNTQPRPSWTPPRVEMALVAGYHPPGYVSSWLLLDRNDEPTRSLLCVRLFRFNMAGYIAAREASTRFRQTHAPDAVNLTARVVVDGDWTEPQDIVEAWRLEGSEPRDIGRYPFE